MKIVLIILGILFGTAGGVIAYRALYIEPRSAVLITNSEVKELPDYKKVVGGSLLLISGAAVAFFAARNLPRT
jgi:hypothetical protein